VRPLLPLLAACVALFPARAGAEISSTRHPLHRLVETERAPQRFVGDAVISGAVPIMPRPPSNEVPAPPLDCIHANHDIRLDPGTGQTYALLELTVRAHDKSLRAIGLALDEGLSVGEATSDHGSVVVTDQVYAPSRVIRLDLSPALEPGESTTVTVQYAGVLGCGPYETGGRACTKNRDFSYFAQQSIVPYIFDPADPYSYALDAMTREIVLRVPASIDVVATGEKVSETIEGNTLVSRWSIGRPLARTLGIYVFAGKLGMLSVPGRSVPTTLVFPTPELPMDASLVSWSTPVLDFVEKVGGTPLPFQKSLTLVRLPADLGDPGTATFGMTLLSETYARAGDLMHEETWAHENAHLFWGIVVPEKSSLESRMLSEGLATLAELDYTYTRHFQGTDRDRYLARRFVPIALDLRGGGAELPAVQLPPGQALPDRLRTQLYTLWAYYKTSATLDHLRVTVGDDVFAKGLTTYVERCSFVGCHPDDLRSVLEEVSGQNLVPFFERWVSGSTRPEVSVGFTTTPNGADIELTKADALPMTLELWLTLEDGQRLKHRVTLGGRRSRTHVETPVKVRSVAASPRHDVLVDVRSHVEGDLDFDGEADGLDLLRCTRLVGRTYEAATGVGLWNIDETFDPRCDVDGDMTIDDHDIAELAASFGTLRAR
jgi:hypothetical protein